MKASTWLKKIGHKRPRPVKSKPTDPPSQPARKVSAIGKVASFAKAVIGPKVSDEVFRERLAICQSNQCGHLLDRDGKQYCRACGCPEWGLSELRSKLRYANVECPENIWGKATT